MPLLSAQVETEVGFNLDDSKFRIIVDGVAYEPEFDSESSSLLLQMTEPLKERFHVVTFEATNSEGNIERETKIFYVEGITNNLSNLVQYFVDEGELSSDDVFRSLNIHLESVNHYEEKGATEKVMKHMEGFQVLLEQFKEKDFMSEKVYNVLSGEAQFFIDYIGQ